MQYPACQPAEQTGHRTGAPQGHIARGLVVLLFVFCCAPAPAAIGSVEHYLQSARQAGKTANRLLHESSPYLLQHAYNPVSWYPWGEAAFAAARAQNKPIFLSIGYSTCHWCHVMARESFENEAIATILNAHFISIKVDREERPDIDKVYMQASEIINGYGGWPLTAFLNHQLQPFHVGTYYPPGPVGHHRGLKQLLLDVQQLWTKQRQQVDRRASELSDQIGQKLDAAGTDEALSRDIDKQAMRHIMAEFDREYGGFGAAPKFPRPGLYLYLAGMAQRDKTHAAQAGDMLHTTLQHMAMGGIYDHVGGGFHRYSVDAAWRVPHFEKMLYSQALLALVYTQAYQLEQRPLYKDVVRGTLDYVVNVMVSKQGGFYSALDADSERADKKGETAEGAYYLWHQQEVKKLLTVQEWQLVRDYYSLEQDGNIDSDPNDEFGDRNILYVNEDYRHATLTPQQEQRLRSARAKLLAAREQRSPPHLDDKIIVAWNGMMITAFVRACAVFERPRYCQIAQEAARFIKQNLVNVKTGEVLRRYRNGNAGVAGMLDDYVWLVRASLELYAASDDSDWLKLAQMIAAKQQQLFYDAERGGYFASTDEDTSVLFRAREIHDGATVAANAVAVENLVDLAKYSGDKNWLRPARKTVNAFASSINATPAVSTMMLYTSFKFRHD